MNENRFRIVFDHMDQEIEEQSELQSDVITDTLKQNSEIKKIIDIINDAVPTYRPILYSGS